MRVVESQATYLVIQKIKEMNVKDDEHLKKFYTNDDLIKVDETIKNIINELDKRLSE